MAITLNQRFDKLELQKAALLAELSKWPEDKVNFRPDAASWSALDVVSHLLRVESGFVSTAKANLPEGKPVSAKDKLGALTVIAVMRSSVRVKVPPAAAGRVMPMPAGSLAELSAQWTEERMALQTFIDSVQPDQLEFGVFLHPVAGWMPTETALKFLDAHLRHHNYQINRLHEAIATGT